MELLGSCSKTLVGEEEQQGRGDNTSHSKSNTRDAHVEMIAESAREDQRELSIEEQFAQFACVPPERGEVKTQEKRVAAESETNPPSVPETVSAASLPAARMQHPYSPPESLEDHAFKNALRFLKNQKQQRKEVSAAARAADSRSPSSERKRTPVLPKDQYLFEDASPSRLSALRWEKEGEEDKEIAAEQEREQTREENMERELELQQTRMQVETEARKQPGTLRGVVGWEGRLSQGVSRSLPALTDSEPVQQRERDLRVGVMGGNRREEFKSNVQDDISGNDSSNSAYCASNMNSVRTYSARYYVSNVECRLPKIDLSISLSRALALSYAHVHAHTQSLSLSI